MPPTIISSHASFDADESWTRFARSSGLPVGYFGDGRRNRAARMLRRATLAVSIVMLLGLGFWATGASVPDELIRPDARPARAAR